MQVLYGKSVLKSIKKGKIPRDIWIDTKDAFDSLAKTNNYRLFDIKKLITKGTHSYYRLRIRGYRALFRADKAAIYVEEIGPRGGIYKS